MCLMRHYDISMCIMTYCHYNEQLIPHLYVVAMMRISSFHIKKFHKSLVWVELASGCDTLYRSNINSAMTCHNMLSNVSIDKTYRNYCVI